MTLPHRRAFGGGAVDAKVVGTPTAAPFERPSARRYRALAYCPPMPTDRKDLATRLSLARPTDTARGLTFNALFATITERLGKAAAVALDPDHTGHRTEFFSFPVAHFLQISFDAADKLEPILGSADKAFRAFGHRTTSNVLGSPMGATMLKLAGKDRLKSLINQSPAGYRTMVSYGVRKVEWPAETHAFITFEGDFLVPAYHCGVYEAAIEAIGAHKVRVEGRQTGPLDATFDVEWS